MPYTFGILFSRTFRSVCSQFHSKLRLVANRFQKFRFHFRDAFYWLRGPYPDLIRDSRIESLMVIGYNPSHSNINSEVNVPFKILSTLLRFLNTDFNSQSKNQGPRPPAIEDPYEIENDNTNMKIANKGSVLNGFKMPRNTIGMGLNSGERLDTMEGYDNNYGEEDDKISQDDNQYQYGEESDQDKFNIDDEKLQGKKIKSKTLEDKQE